jgi:hypothetical protein
MKPKTLVATSLIMFASVSGVLAQPRTGIPLGDTITVTIQLARGWNIVSNPVITANDSVPVLFPMCLAFCDVWPPPPYIDSCLLHPGMGRWVKCPEGGTVHLTVISISVDIIPVAASWNFIGSLSYPIPTSSVSTIPPNIIVSVFWGFIWGIGYVRVDTLRPGSAYWVKTNQQGRIVLSTGF